MKNEMKRKGGEERVVKRGWYGRRREGGSLSFIHSFIHLPGFALIQQNERNEKRKKGKEGRKEGKAKAIHT
jgi:hypothetical protein